MTTTEDRPLRGESPPTHEPASAQDEQGDLGPRFDPRHFGIEPGDPWPEDVPYGQDDSHWRYEDDPRGARRAELRIAACWMVTLIASVGLAVTYVEGGQTQISGVCWALAFLGLGVGLIFWARDLMPGNEVIASRGHHATSPEVDRRAATEALSRGMEPIARRPFLYKVLGAVGGVFGLAALFPLASLGPRPHTSLYDTGWGRLTRAVTEDGNPVRPEDINVNGIVTVFPEGNIDNALAATLLVNVGDAPFEVPSARVGWNIGSLLAFSKICTHAGCPVGLYNVQTHQLVCPCHQSTFDVLKDCKPVFGPAPRSLPQLAISLDSDGYIVSDFNYTQAVGPGFWNRG